ncbi:MAG: hypothetical protein SGJ20_15140 [Planctomycetota bacterium]|nr:hypothetical protein [Planctomycetota bacterium]
MSSATRDELLGYLLGALDSAEHKGVETELQTNAQLRRELELLRHSLVPLSFDPGHIDAPHGLAKQTCLHVYQAHCATPVHEAAHSGAAHTAAGAWPTPATNAIWPVEPTASTRRWRLVDMAVAAGILIAGAAIVIPAIMQSRVNSDRIACQKKLHDNYLAISDYSKGHGNTLPVADESGALSFGGAYAPKLVSAGLMPNISNLFCQTSMNGEAIPTQIPTVEQLNAASPAEHAKLVKQLDNIYAFGLGHRDAQGKYHLTKRKEVENGKGRSYFPLMADLPAEDGSPLGHHGGCGTNVLFEDGSIKYHTGCKTDHEKDDIFKNARGEQKAGLHENDSVLVPSSKTP